MYQMLIISLLFLLIGTTGCSSSASSSARVNLIEGLSHLSDNPTLAKLYLDRAHRLAPKNSEILGAMGFFWEKQAEPTTAEPYYQSAIRYTYSPGKAHNNYGIFLCRQHRYTEGLIQFKAAAQDLNYRELEKLQRNQALCQKHLSS